MKKNNLLPTSQNQQKDLTSRAKVAINSAKQKDFFQFLFHPSVENAIDTPKECESLLFLTTFRQKNKLSGLL